MAKELKKKLFGELALQHKFITTSQLNEALQIKVSKPNWPLGEILCFLGYITEKQVQTILHLQLPHSHSNTVTYFGRYKILEELGSGGMGRVFKAYDPQLDRDVALKVLKYGDGASSTEVERFLREAKATAQLRHPNIVALYDLGNENGQNFFTMDFVSGGSLKNYHRKTSLTIEQVVHIMIKIADAVGYAHRCGIIHRDIKPSNIMLTSNDEPKVMDFGLAKISSLHDSISQTGDVLGTPAYMSPEQAQSTTIDKRSDIYSLGVTFYELLVGKLPFVGSSYLDVLYQVVHHEPVSLRTYRSQIPSALDAICMKCMEKIPRKRYQSSEEFIGDLQNFLQNKPIVAKTNNLKYIKRFFYSRKTLFFIIVVLIIIIAILLYRQ